MKKNSGSSMYRDELLRVTMELNLSESAMLAIAEPMRSMTVEEKEAYAAETLKKLQSGENPFSAD